MSAIDTLKKTTYNLVERATNLVTPYNTPENIETVQKVAAFAGLITVAVLYSNYSGTKSIVVEPKKTETPKIGSNTSDRETQTENNTTSDQVSPAHNRRGSNSGHEKETLPSAVPTTHSRQNSTESQINKPTPSHEEVVSQTGD